MWKTDQASQTVTESKLTEANNCEATQEAWADAGNKTISNLLHSSQGKNGGKK